MESIFSPFPEIETPRLRLRPLRYTDEQEALRSRNDPRILKYLIIAEMQNLEETREWMDKMNKGAETGEWIYWAIADKHTDKFMGSIALWKWERTHNRCEVGYTLLPEYWRKGYMKEALTAAVHFGRTTMKLHSVEAHLSPENIASLKTLAACGFVECGHFTENVFHKGSYRDTLVMEIIFTT